MTRPLARSARLVLSLLALTFLVAAGCGGDDDNGGNNGGTADVTIHIVPNAFNKGMMAFNPDTTTTTVGKVVGMHNGDSITHVIQTVTSGGPSWGTVSAGGQANATAAQAGTFTFQCTVSGHTMTGTLIVNP
jgi:plastocyanin